MPLESADSVVWSLLRRTPDKPELIVSSLSRIYGNIQTTGLFVVLLSWLTFLLTPVPDEMLHRFFFVMSVISAWAGSLVAFAIQANLGRMYGMKPKEMEQLLVYYWQVFQAPEIFVGFSFLWGVAGVSWMALFIFPFGLYVAGAVLVPLIFLSFVAVLLFMRFYLVPEEVARTYKAGLDSNRL